MTEPGQTDDYDVSEHVKAIIEHAGEGVIETCICDTGEIIPEFIRRYNLAGSNLVNTDKSAIKEMGIKVIQKELATIEDDHIRHDSDEIANIIIELICDELKFEDKQKDEQFLLLNTKLKEEKKKKKKKKVSKTGKRAKGSKILKLIRKIKNREKKASKFNMKYQDRIKSIKNSEKTRQQRLKLQQLSEKMAEDEEKKEKDKFIKEARTKKKK